MLKRKPKDPERSPDLPHNWISRHLARVAEFAIFDPVAIPGWEYRRVRHLGPGTYEDIDPEFRPIQLGQEWGGEDTTGLFRATMKVPGSHASPDAALQISLDGGEAQLTINGRPWQGLDWYRSIVPLCSLAQEGAELNLEIEAFINNYPYDERRGDARDVRCFRTAHLVRIDRDIEGFLSDAQFALDFYMDLREHDGDLEIESHVLYHLEEACRVLGPRLKDQGSAREACGHAREILRRGLFTNAFQPPGRIGLCGHSHLDIIYLWPIKETFRKNCRTATNMLSLMREFDDYTFTYSQPYLYEKLKEMHPTVFEEIVERVREGRWEVVGGMYVEPDGNLLGPESLVRQILFGKRFIREALGVDTRTCWLPDVFGVMYTLPQVLKKSGIDFFLTNKLNIWNDSNVFPHDAFRWRGPDGSEVVTHFPPTHFGQALTPGNLRRHWKDFREKKTVGEDLFIYGWADGGGGPTREMVQAADRARRFSGLPNSEPVSAEAFFSRLEEKVSSLAVWDDELYLEAHRGTLTTKGQLKRLNRKAEMLYRDAEILSILAWANGGRHGQDELHAGWKLLLLHQFHDTLPGTHSTETVPDILRDYDTVFKTGRAAKQRAVNHLVAGILSQKPETPLVVFNTLGWRRTDVVSAELPKGTRAVVFPDETVPVQWHDDTAWFCTPELPSVGWLAASASAEADSPGHAETATYADNVLETGHYRVRFGPAGVIESLYDRDNDREVLSGQANHFQVYEDDPGTKFSAWNLAYHLEQYQYEVSLQSGWTMHSNGPVFAALRASWAVLDSTIEQEMRLYRDSRRIDFITRAVWKDKKKMLKVAFPLAIRTRTATYDLPFGNIERPTHQNTSWDAAKFEVCGHKWADLSEGNYGVALMNDCKYGYDARENVLRLSLIRSPVRPDAESDIGEHEFTYSVFPHRGDWRTEGVDREAYGLNAPAIVASGSSEDEAPVPLPARYEFISVSSENVIVEAVKQAENGDGIIIRSFDNRGCRGPVEFAIGEPFDTVIETDLIEQDLEEDSSNRQDRVKRGSASGFRNPNRFTAPFSPYEIKTHRLRYSER